MTVTIDGTNSQNTHINIDQTSFTIGSVHSQRLKQIAEACGKNDQSTIQLLSSPLDLSEFSPLWSSMTLGCQWVVQGKLSDQPLLCRIPQTPTKGLESKISKLEKQLFRYRQRHPYILARRVAFARKMVEVITGDNSLAQLCKIAKLSNPLELTLPMRSETWMASACMDSGYHTNKTSRMLRKAIEDSIWELNFLLTAFKNTKTGVLTLKLPRDQGLGRDFWVKLTPEQLSGMPRVKSVDCYWHPLYQSPEDKTIFAQIIPAAQKIAPCKESNADETEQRESILANYLATSVASQTEFAISNGRGKVLALPKGIYKFSLHRTANPYSRPNFVSAPEPLLGGGKVEWTSRRPYPVIKETSKISRKAKP